MKLSEDGNSLITENGAIIDLPWRGRDVSAANGGYLVLLQTDRNNNVVFIETSGKIRWFAEQSIANDRYCGVSVENKKLIAHSCGCFQKELDPETGKILSEVYTK